MSKTWKTVITYFAVKGSLAILLFLMSVFNDPKLEPLAAGMLMIMFTVSIAYVFTGAMVWVWGTNPTSKRRSV